MDRAASLQLPLNSPSMEFYVLYSLEILQPVRRTRVKPPFMDHTLAIEVLLVSFDVPVCAYHQSRLLPSSTSAPGSPAQRRVCTREARKKEKIQKLLSKNVNVQSEI